MRTGNPLWRRLVAGHAPGEMFRLWCEVHELDELIRRQAHVNPRG